MKAFSILLAALFAMNVWANEAPAADQTADQQVEEKKEEVQEKK